MTDSAPLIDTTAAPAASRRTAILVVAGIAAVAAVAAVASGGVAYRYTPTGHAHQVKGAAPPRVVTLREAKRTAAQVAPGSVVTGNSLVWFGLGDWGRCGAWSDARRSRCVIGAE